MSSQSQKSNSKEVKEGKEVKGSIASKARAFGEGFLAASIAEVVTIPLDTAKVRMQLDPMKLKYQNPVQTLRLCVEEEGGRALFGGLPAAVLRAGTIYATRYPRADIS